jgi:hypothetical protein
MQIDWLSFTTGTQPELCPGYTSGWQSHVDPEGEVLKRWPAFLPILGSYDDRILVKTPDPCTLYLTGNPVKFFQGHNLFGSTDAIGLALEAGWAVRKEVGMFPSPATWGALEFSKPRFSRIDLTRSYRFQSEAEALDWIRSVASVSRSRHGAALTRGETVYFGQHSRRWSMKIYPKRQELLAHKPRSGPARIHFDLLADWARGVVRFEVVIRGPELDGLPLNFDPLTLWQSYYDRITLNENAAMSLDRTLIEQTLKPHQQMAMMSWRNGLDLRTVYSKAGFYKLRRELLELLAVDISQPPQSVATAAAPSALLDPAGWDPEPIKEHGLYFEPDSHLVKQYGLL